jgi:hypothetical protein
MQNIYKIYKYIHIQMMEFKCSAELRKPISQCRVFVHIILTCKNAPAFASSDFFFFLFFRKFKMTEIKIPIRSWLHIYFNEHKYIFKTDNSIFYSYICVIFTRFKIKCFFVFHYKWIFKK